MNPLSLAASPESIETAAKYTNVMENARANADLIIGTGRSAIY